MKLHACGVRCPMRWIKAVGAVAMAIGILTTMSVSQVPSASASLVPSCGGSAYGKVLVAGTAWSGLPASRGDLNVYNNASCFPSNWEAVGTYGLQWQCTELAARWADVAWGEGGYRSWTATGWNGAAADMWRVAPSLRVPLTRYANGGAMAPRKGDILVMSDGSVGHVAVVTGISGGRLNFVGENQGNAGGASSIPITGTTAVSNGWLSGSHVVGWMRGPTDPFTSTTPFSYQFVKTVAERVDGTPMPDPSHFWWGERGKLAITVQNTGTQTWGTGVPIRIGPSNPVDQPTNPLYAPGWLSPGRVAQVATPVAPGGTYTFTFPFIANFGSSYTQQFNLVAEGVTWFAQDASLRTAFPIEKTVDRGIALRHHGTGGYTLAPDGTVTAFGGAPTLAGTGTAGWPSWDIARGIVLRSDDQGGYVLDGYGGMHPFGTAPVLTPAPPYWGWDIARAVVLRSDNLGGYVLDGWGGVHQFGNAPAVARSAYWPNWDIARSIALTSDAGGYVLDGYGGLQPFGTASALTSVSPYWGWDIARSMTDLANGQGYVLDGYGGVHAVGNAKVIGGPYWGVDLAKAIASTPSAGTWDLDAAGNVHPIG